MIESAHLERFTELLAKSEDIVKAQFPVIGDKSTLTASNFRWRKVGADVLLDVKRQRDVKLKEGTLNAVLVADVKIKNESGKVLDEKNRHPILLIPHLTANGSYLVKGKEVQVVSQFRLRPGIYTSDANDNQVEVFLNTTASRTLKILLNRDTGLIRLRIGSGFHVPIYSVLRCMGMRDAEIRQLLTNELYPTNFEAADLRRDVERMLSKLRPYAQSNELDEQMRLVREFMESKPLDPAVNKLTVGRPVSKIDRSAFYEGVKKALAVSRKEAQADDKESLAFKSIHSVEDFVPEKIQNAAPAIQRKLKFELMRNPTIDSVIPPMTFSEPVTQFFTTSEFTRYSDQNNPLDMASVNALVTTIGDGGISSSHAITDDVRTVHPSHFSLLDPLHTPEGDKVGVTNHLSLGAIKKGQTLFVPVYVAATGKRTEVSVQDLDGTTVAFPDQYSNMPEDPKKGFDGKPKPKDPESVRARRRNQIADVKASEVDYIFVSPDAFFSSTTAMVPFLNNNHANRVLMGDKHVEQSVGLVDPDKPLVQHRLAGGGYEELFGSALTPKAVDIRTGEARGGVVTEVTDDYIKIRPSRGRVYKVPLRHNYPLNSNTYLHDEPIVKVGDRVKAGQDVARNNFTKDGSLAMGKNLKVAYTAWKGYNFEDGIVISESCAKKLTSTHKYEFRVQIKKKVHVGRKKYLAAFPTEVANCPADLYTESGIVKKGATVPPGTVLIPAIQEAEYHPEYDYSKLHRSAGLKFVDISEVWDSAYEGTVVDVVESRGFVKVYIHTKEQMQVGDKLSSRHGSKGIVTCFDDQTDILTANGWKPFSELTLSDKISAQIGGRLEFVTPEALHRFDYSGPMYGVANDHLDYLVTPDHRVWSRIEHYRGQTAEYKFQRADEVKGRRYLQYAAKSSLPEHTAAVFVLPKAARAKGRDCLRKFNTEDFAELLGWYLAEGCLAGGRYGVAQVRQYRIHIAQSQVANPDNCKRIGALLTKLGITWKYHYTDKSRGHGYFRFANKAVYEYLHSLGNAWEKYIPEHWFHTSQAALTRLVDAFNLGDGAKRPKHQAMCISITSEQLAVDLHRAWVLTGGSGVIRFVAGRNEYRDQWCLSLYRDRVEQGFQNKDRYTTEYSGEVFCVTVPGGLVYVRRNGKCHWSGNCILPDNEMPKGQDDQTIDLLMNPAGVPGRVNTGQLFEAAAGKLAEKTGKVYYADNFNEKGTAGTLQKLKKELADAGISDEETIVDPTTGDQLDDVLVGNMTWFKLKHQVSKKISARAATGERYSVDQQPTKGGDASAQRIGALDTFSLLSGDATAFLHDAFGLKSQRNDEYWRAVQTGQPTPPPQTPFVEEKFIAMLLAAGINLEQSGSTIKATPMTDNEILSMSSGELKKPLVVNAKNLNPEKGGLFDPGLTGGIGGNRWNHITLETPVVHPLMIDAVAAVGAFKTKKQLQQIIDRQLFVTPDGQITEEAEGNITGADGVRRILDNVDVEKEIQITEKAAAGKRGTGLDKAHKRLRYLKALKVSGIKPADAYVNKQLPVIPPKFRQIAVQPDGTLSVADAVHGYREVMLVNNQIRELRRLGVDEENLRPLYQALTGAVGGVVGTSDPLTRARNFQGFVSQIKGKTAPKYGFFQSKVSGRAQDLTGRSTVIPNPKMHLDEVGVPQEMAARVYKPFVVKRLQSMGKTPIEARKAIEENDPLAVKALEIEMEHRPVLMNRAPSLHKFSIQAFKPRLIQGKAVEVNPLIVGGFNMDFDGDTAGIHVPVSEEARKEAFDRLLPSKNLFSPQDHSLVHSPTKETALGVYLMTTPKVRGNTPSVSNWESLFQLYRDKKVKANQAARVGGQVHCIGQWIYAQTFPQAVRPAYRSTTRKLMDADLERAGRELSSGEAARVITEVKNLGNHYVTEVGFSVSLRDLEIDTKKRDAVIRKAKRRSKTVGYDVAANEAVAELSLLLDAAINNRFVEAGPLSGALGKKGQIQQMVLSPVGTRDHKNQVVPIIVGKSYAEGHDLGAYLSTTPGARKGLIDKGLSVADTGYLSRLLVNSNVEMTIKADDCGTMQGIEMSLDDKEISDRYGAEGAYRNQIITQELARRLRQKGEKRIKVRSPMTCKAVGGICQKCFGLDESGKSPRIGFHIGALAGQTIGERATQVTLRAFHTGGAVGSESNLGFDRIKQILEMPQTIRGKAVLAQNDGVVNKIEPGPTGGDYVFVSGTRHFIPQELATKVTRGQRVKAGDQLSRHGIVEPKELLDLTGDLPRVQNYLIDELDKNYSASGSKIRRKIYETAITPLTNRAKVTEANDGSKFGVVSGDFVLTNQIEEYNAKIRKMRGKEIEYEPLVAGIKAAPSYSTDFVGSLIHEKLQKTLERAPTMGLKTDLQKGHPISQLALTNLRSIDSVKRPVKI